MTKRKDQQQPPNSSPVCYANSRELREGYDMFPAPEPTLQKKKKVSKPVGKK